MSKDWKTPPGLTQGTWDYVRASHIASGYDQFLKGDRLARFDTELLLRLFPSLDKTSSAPRVADFGAGNGRSLLPICQRGYRGLAIDLSQNMLGNLLEKVDHQNDSSQHEDAIRLNCVQANLVELDGISDGVADHGICMFSTLGMIKGRANRERFLAHARRIIKARGKFVVHVHNYWFQLRHAGGMRWIVSNGLDALRARAEVGDRYAEYRGVNRMFIHSFRKREIEGLLKRSNFKIDDVIPFEDETHSGWLSDIGWFFVCS